MARGLGPGGARAYTLLLEGRCRFQLSRLIAEEPFLLAAVTQLDLVPPRAEVVRQLSTGLTVNFVGLGATVVGLQATTGVLFAKSLTAAAASPFTPGGYNPVLALDIFLIQAGANVMFAHWIGAAISLWLLRTVNLPTPAR